MVGESAVSRTSAEERHRSNATLEMLMREKQKSLKKKPISDS